MYLSLYTNYNDLKYLDEGDNILAWTEEKRYSDDVNIIVDMDKYGIRNKDDGYFEICKVLK